MNDLMLIIIVLVPILVGTVSVLQRTLSHRHVDMAGYVYDGRKWVLWVFLALLASWIVWWIAPMIDGGHTHLFTIHKGAVAFYIFVYGTPILYLISYVLVAFKPVTAVQLAAAKEDKRGKRMVIEVSGQAAAGFWSVLGGTFMVLLEGLMTVLNPIYIISQMGNTITYVKGGMSASITSFVSFGLIIVIVILIILYATAFIYIGAPIVLGIGVVVKYLLNLILYHNAPRPDEMIPTPSTPVE